jgi:hypothetical protein
VRVAVRILLGFFAVEGLLVGGWQLLAPRSFWTDFPGLGRHWVSGDGGYNEHLLRDVGQGTLAIGLVAVIGLVSGSVWVARATGLAALVANLPHQLYHQTHLDRLPTDLDRVLQTAVLSLVSLAAVVLTVLAFRLPVHPGGPDRPVRARLGDDDDVG